MKTAPVHYYLDTEFCEGLRQPRWMGIPVGKPIATIDLISIALVCDGGREYYALNADCDLDYAWANDFVRQNVLATIYREHVQGDLREHVKFSLLTMRAIFRGSGQPLATIAQEVLRFVFPIEWLASELNKRYPYPFTTAYGEDEVQVGVGSYLTRAEVIELLQKEGANMTPAFWAYYADYDWVVFCQQLFGSMNDLPTGFPMCCYDLKQLQDSLGMSKREKQTLCPDPQDEHNALVDARWDRAFHTVLQAYQPALA